ncbi:MAG TPA: hypothetical protein DGG95_00640 [Cytophagales bacterium]|jgi:hypothetical protein|nr:hypothetical protein [Cytophagales bacterium]
MASQNLVEYTVNQLIDHMQTNLPTALADVRTDRIDALVTTEPPQNSSYFIYEKIIGYKTPAIVTVATDVDFRLARGPNSVSALIGVVVSCVVEDRIANNLTIKTYRYSDALYSVLNRAQFTDDVNLRKSIVKVTRMDFSRTVENVSQDTSNPFRKEVMLTLEVEHYENEV